MSQKCVIREWGKRFPQDKERRLEAKAINVQSSVSDCVSYFSCFPIQHRKTAPSAGNILLGFPSQSGWLGELFGLVNVFGF